MLDEIQGLHTNNSSRAAASNVVYLGLNALRVVLFYLLV